MGRVGPQNFGAGQKKNGRGRNFGVGRTDDFINFYHDSNILLMILVFSLWCLQTLYFNEHPVNLLYITLILIPLFPWEDIISKNQKIKSICKLLQYEKSY